MNRFRVFLLLILSISLTGVTVWHFASAIPAPSRSSICEPGNCTTVPCTWDNYIDGSTYMAKNCQTGVGTAYTTAYNLWQGEIASNQADFFEPGLWCFTCSAGAGANFLNFQNVTLWGVYGQTVFNCNVAACIALNIGNQAAVDAIYHAQNVTIHDMTFDGGGFSNSACMSISVSLNVYINHVIFQNCYELGTGCFRVTNWNTQQLLSRNVYVENTLFTKCKITVSGLINGFIRNSIFQGLANGASGTKALVDFSKGDIVPTSVNNLGNFCFCGNMISGWTLQIFLGFQAVSNDTIGWNTVRDANTFMQTTDTAGGIYFEGLMVVGNFYSSATGNFINLGYGHSVKIVDNIVSLDTTPASASTAISITESGDPTVNQQPKNIEVSRNEIYKWGGIGIYANFTDGFITGNEVYDVNQAAGSADGAAGLITVSKASNILIEANSIISDVGSGAGQSRPIAYNGGTNILITGNQLLYTNCGLNVICGIKLAVAPTTSLSISNNFGYDPLGVITNPLDNTAVTIGPGAATPTSTITVGNTYKVVGLGVYVTTTGTVTIQEAGGNTIVSGLVGTTAYYLGVGFTIKWTVCSACTMTAVGV